MRYLVWRLSVLFVGAAVVFGASRVAAETGFSGMQVQGMSAEIANVLGRENAGVLVRDVAADGPAAQAGVFRGDIILKLNGRAIPTFNALLKLLSKSKPGQEVALDLLRAGKPIALKMKLASKPDAWKVTRGAVVSLPDAGITMAAVTPKIRKRFNLRWGSVGVLVSLIDPAFADRMHLERGDLIVQVNQKPVWHPDQIQKAYRAAKFAKQKRLLILIERIDGFRYMMLPVK